MASSSDEDPLGMYGTTRATGSPMYDSDPDRGAPRPVARPINTGQGRHVMYVARDSGDDVETRGLTSGNSDAADTQADNLHSPPVITGNRGTLNLQSPRVVRQIVRLWGPWDALRRRQLDENTTRQQFAARDALRQTLYQLSPSSKALVETVRTCYVMTVIGLAITWILESVKVNGARGFIDNADLICSSDPTEMCSVWNYKLALLLLILTHFVVTVLSIRFAQWRTDFATARWLRATATTFVVLGGVYSKLPAATAETVAYLFVAVAGSCFAMWVSELTRHRGVVAVWGAAKFFGVLGVALITAVTFNSVVEEVDPMDRVIVFIVCGALILQVLISAFTREKIPRYNSAAANAQDMRLIAWGGVLDLTALLSTSVILVLHKNK